MISIRRLLTAMASTALLATGACTTTPSAANEDADMAMLAAILSGAPNPDVNVAEVEARARVHPLGAEQNPIRAHMPGGQRAYLSRLRCSNGQPPQFARIGNFGVGVYGNIIDGYDVVCTGGEPARSTLFLDMYHPGHVERSAPPGFTIVP